MTVGSLVFICNLLTNIQWFELKIYRFSCDLIAIDWSKEYQSLQDNKQKILCK